MVKVLKRSLLSLILVISFFIFSGRAAAYELAYGVNVDGLTENGEIYLGVNESKRIEFTFSEDSSYALNKCDIKYGFNATVEQGDNYCVVTAKDTAGVFFLELYLSNKYNPEVIDYYTTINVRVGREIIVSKLNSFYFTNKNITYSEYLNLQSKSLTIPYYLTNNNGHCSLDESTMTYACSGDYYLSDYNENVAYNYGGQIIGDIKKVYNYYVSQNSGYISPDWDTKNMLFLVEDETIISYENNQIVGLSEGKTRILGIDRKTFEVSIVNVTVSSYQSNSVSNMTIAEISEKINAMPLEFTVDVKDYKNMGYDYIAKKLFYNYLFGIDWTYEASYNNFYDNGATCENGLDNCTVTFTYSEENTWNYLTYTSLPFDIKFEGISINNISIIAGYNTELDFITSQYTSGEVIYEYDEEMIEIYEEYDEWSQTNKKYMKFKKPGYASLTVKVGDYSDTEVLGIQITDAEYDEYLTLNNANYEIELDYSKDNFKDNLEFLSQVVEEKYLTIFPESIKQYLKIDTTCVSDDFCIVSLSSDGYILRNNITLTKNIKYNNTNNDLVNLDKVVSNVDSVYIVPFDNYIKVNNLAKGNSDAYYQELVKILGITDFAKDAAYTIQYNNQVKTTLFDNVYGNLAFTLDIFYNQKRIFTKDVEIITLPYLDIPLEVEHTRSGRAQYAENYLKNILGTESVSCEIDDTYEYIINANVADEYVLKFAYLQDEYVNANQIYSTYSTYQMAIGDTAQIELGYYPENANVFPQVTYQSNDPEVATVSGSGLIEAKKKGFAVIDYIGDNYRYWGQLLVLVDMTIEEFLDMVANDIENNVVVSYGTFRAVGTQALSDALEYKTLNEKLKNYYIQTIITEENDNYYFYKKYYDYRPNWAEYNSQKQIINYTLKGIYIEKEIYSISSGETVDVNISYTEGNNNKMFYRTDTPGIVNFDLATGKLTGLNSGIVRVDVYDEKGIDYNYFYAYVNEEEYINSVINRLKTEGLRIDVNQAQWGLDSAAHSALWSEFDYLEFERNITCNTDTKICDVIMDINGITYEDSIPYVIVGILLPEQIYYGNPYTIEVNETLQLEILNYTASEDKTLRYISSNAEVCSVDADGVITGLKAGVCEVTVSNVDGETKRIPVVVDETAVKAELDAMLDLLPDEIDLPLPRYNNEDYDGGDETEAYLIVLTNIFREYFDDEHFYWFYFGLGEMLENNDDTLTVSFDRTYVSEQGYHITNIAGTASKRIKANFLEDPPMGDEHAQGIIDALKREYDLTMVEALRYQFDQSKNKEIWRYCGDLLNTLKPGYDFIFDARAGSADDQYTATEGGFVILMYNGTPIYTTQAFFTARFYAPQDAPKTQEEFTRYLTQLIIDTYKDINTPSVFTYGSELTMNFRQNMYVASNEPNVTVDYIKSKGLSELYWVTVDESEFGLEVKRVGGSVEDAPEVVTNITLDKENVTLNQGEKLTVNYTINPSSLQNSVVTWKTSNENVATIENGVITAVGAGSAIITATIDGVSDTIEVMVKEVSLKNILTQIGYKIGSSFVRGFNLNDKIADLQIKVGSNTQISSKNKVIATGVQFTLNGQSYTAVINGDISGDGLINSADLLAMRQHLLGTKVLSGAYKEAAAIVNGQTINSSDLLRLRQYLLGEYVIKQ